MKRSVLMSILSLLVIATLLIPGPIAFAQESELLSESEIGQSIAELQLYPPLYHETFREDNGVWELDDTDEYSLRYVAGAYRIEVLADTIFAWGVGQQEVEDFYLEVDTFFLTGPESNEYGVVFRQMDNENFYAFSISSEGYYALRKLHAGEWLDLIEWTESDALRIEAGAVNRLGVYARGPQIALLINDEVVDQVEESEFSSGQIGLAAGVFDEAGLDVAFDDLKLWDLKTPITPLPTPEVTPTPIDVSARLDEIRANPPDLSDEFRRDTGAWTQDSDENVSYRIAGREFTILVNKANWIGWSVNNEFSAGDLLAETDVALASGPSGAEFGLLFRYQDNRNFYFFAIIPGSQSFSLWKTVNGQWEVVSNWTKSDAIDIAEGATNRLGVLAEGNLITALINDQAVAQVSDETFSGGGLALAVGTFDEGGAEVIFDNVDAWVLSAAPPPVETPEPTATPEPAPPDVQAQLDAIRSAPATVTSEFRRDDGSWTLEDTGGVSQFYARRSLHILVDRADWLSWSQHASLSPADFLIEVDVAHVKGPLAAEYGLIFRQVDDNNFYFYAITSEGFYGLWKQVDGEWQTIVSWTELPELQRGEGALNRLGVLAEGEQITLLHNGVGVRQVSDASHREGKISLAVGAFDEPGIEVSFDNFALWDLGQ